LLLLLLLLLLARLAMMERGLARAHRPSHAEIERRGTINPLRTRRRTASPATANGERLVVSLLGACFGLELVGTQKKKHGPPACMSRQTRPSTGKRRGGYGARNAHARAPPGSARGASGRRGVGLCPP
jgi:hypothetical protein